MHNHNFKLCFDASHAPFCLIYIGKVVGVLWSINTADLKFSSLLASSLKAILDHIS